jgi:hypothetical protein
MARKPEPNPANYHRDALAAAAADMNRILSQHLQLTDHGFGTFIYPAAKEVLAANFKRDRETIRDARSIAAFIATRYWLADFPKIKTLNQKGTSYGLKHIAEEEIGYITNGVFIAAAIAEGFRVVRIDDSPNALLNISSKVWARRQALQDAGYLCV